jgi:hypothetical protein
MAIFLIAALLVCQHGDHAVDWREKIPQALRIMDLVVTVSPAYARFYIYQIGFPESFQQCCGGKPTSVVRVPVGDGRFCIRQSQPQMKWTVRALLRPDIEM